MRGPPAPSGPFLPCTEYRAAVSTSSKLEDVRGAPRSSLPPPAAGCHSLFTGCRSRLLSGTCRLSFKYWFLFLLFVFFPDASDLFPARRYYMPARLCFDNEFSLPLSSKLIWSCWHALVSVLYICPILVDNQNLYCNMARNSSSWAVAWTVITSPAGDRAKGCGNLDCPSKRESEKQGSREAGMGVKLNKPINNERRVYWNYKSWYRQWG